MDMRWDRVIKEINSIDQALKIEENVVKGYYTSILEIINEWINVEEDIMNSYERFNNPNINNLIEDSKNTINILNRILNEINSLVEIRNQRVRLLYELKQTTNQ